MTDRDNRRHSGTSSSQQDGSGDTTWFGSLGALTLDMTEAAQPASPLPSLSQFQQIVFIEGNVPDARQLAAGVTAGTLAVILDPSADGVTQIAAFLARHDVSNLAAIDIVAHGADGTVQLGSATLSSATLAGYQSPLAAIGAALRPGGAIQIYGCDVAQDPAGVAFIDQLSAATGGANVAAASHLVGAASGGGSWDLNVNTGLIDAPAPFTATEEAAYPAELAVPATSDLFLAFNVNNSNGGASIDQIPVSGSSISNSVTTLTHSSDLSSGQGVLGLVVEDPQKRYFVVDDDAALGTGTTDQILVGTFGTNALAAPSYLNFSSSPSISPWGIVESSNPDILYMANYDAANTALNGIWSLNINTGAAAPVAVSSSVIGPDNIALDNANNLAFFTDTFSTVSQIDVGNLSTGAVQILHTTNDSEWLYGIAANAGTLYFDAGNAASVDAVYSASYTVSHGVVSLGAINTLYSIPLNTSVTPTNLAVDPQNGVFYIGDEDNTGSTWNVWEGSLAGSAVQPNLVKIAAVPSYSGAAPDTDALTLMSTPTIVTGGTLAYIGGTSDVLDAGVTVANPDGQGIAGATVKILGGTTNDILTTDLSGTSISASFSASTETLTLSGADTAADYQKVLSKVAFSTTGPNGTRTIDWTVTDGVIPSATSTSSVAVICFCAGTLIGTPDGEVQIEKLKVGDKILTVHNGPRPVVWIGHGKVLATRGRRTAATPVIVLKGALADNVPNQDLHVTKAHGIYIDDVLIPAEFLVNHRSILWDDRAQEVEIYHVELDSHDVLLANGAWAETYRDDGNRWLFQNGNPGWNAPAPEPYVPVLTGGPVVDTAWKRLLRRAGPRSLPPITDDPDLHLLVDGQRVDASDADGQVSVFRLSSTPQTIQVMSREGVPAELGIARDPRSLGVALRWLMLRKETKFEVFLASDSRLKIGFHSYEPDGNLRWTNGSATLPTEPLKRFTGEIEVVLSLAGTTKYPDYGEALGQAAA